MDNIWDSFSSAIHLSEELSEIDKFQYLKSLLVGTAAETISGLPLSGSNYNYAVDLPQEAVWKETSNYFKTH